MRNALFTLLLLVSVFASAQNLPLSQNAQISVITCGPDIHELYSAFGHSAIRVYDPEQQIDLAYNYGVFDFNQPNFYLNYAKGFLYYKLGVYFYPHFRDYYVSNNRYVHEQILDLTSEQKQKIFDYLEWNSAPQNQTYRYDYFYNNCATKIRDVMIESLKDDIKFDETYIKTDYTIRELTDLYLSPQPWGDLGIDICLGLPMDKKATPYEYMFLPDYIEYSFDNATINSKPIVKEKILVYQSTPEQVAFSVFHPWVVFGIFLFGTILISYFNWKNRTLSKWFDVLLFFAVGMIGLLLLLLWIATDHLAAAKNFNLLWAFPLHIVAGPLLIKKKLPRWLVYYFLGTALLLTLTLITWFFLPQQLNIFLLPVVGALLIRALLIYRLQK